MSFPNIATTADIPVLLSLINSAYRGEASRQGWTTEAHLLTGEKRTDADALNILIEAPDSVFLKIVNAEGSIDGCVLLQKKQAKLYLGMLSVKPTAQAKGIGRQLLESAEVYAKQNQCISIYMTVISVRHELIEWYERRGYKKTGDTQPFPSHDSFGIPTRPLEMIVMEKMM